MPLLGPSAQPHYRKFKVTSGGVRLTSGGRQAAATRIQRTWRKKRRSGTPSRFPSGRATYLQTRAVTRVLRNISETKIQALTPQNAIVPKPVEVSPTTGPVYFTAYTLGTAPAAWTGPSGSAAFNNLDGFVWAPGDAANQRNGQYLYLKKTTVNLRVAMKASSRHGPLKFRLIVFKEKRNQYNVSGGGNPCDDLFIDQSGNSRGVNQAAPVSQRVMDFNTWLVNKRNYQVVKDFNFILSPETLSALGSTDPFNVNRGYPQEKTIRLNLGHYQKAKFDTGNVPTDQMYRYGMFLVSMPVTDSIAPANDYVTYVNGVVSCLDN